MGIFHLSLNVTPQVERHVVPVAAREQRNKDSQEDPKKGRKKSHLYLFSADGV